MEVRIACLTMFILMVLASLLAPATSIAAASTIPAQAFFQTSQFNDVKVSPNGKLLAVVGPVKGMEGRVQIDVLDLATSKVEAHYALNKGELTNGIWWVTNQQLLFSTARKLGWFDQPFSTGEVWVLNIQSNELSSFAQGAYVSRVMHRQGGKLGYVQISGNGFVKADEDAQHAKGNNNFTPYQYLTKKCNADGQQPPKNARLITDRHSGFTYEDNTGRARLWFGYNRLTYKDEMAFTLPCKNDDKWYDISSFIEDEPRYTAFGAWGFTRDSKHFYYAGNTKAGTLGLYLVDAKTWQKQLLYEDPNYDIDNTYSATNRLYSVDGMSLVAFEYMADRPVWILVDKNSVKVKMLALMEQTFSGQNVDITSTTADGKLAVIYVSSDRNPGEYYLYDSKKGTVRFLFSVIPGIDPAAMANMEPVSFKVRDGKTVHGYLTRPVGKTKNLPLIINPHGGPFGIRDYWSFEPDVQYLAYHGYAVLQVEFRGSGGYGYAWQKAGYKQWGGTMQDDLTDATKWAIQTGIADPNRICIYGGSYGGYAALEGVEKEPNLYKCAVGYAGVYDLLTFRSHIHTLSHRSQIPGVDITLGNDDAYLKAHSPVFGVKNIKATVMLAHGGFDETVPIAQADEMRDALDGAGKKYEWIYYRTEAHGFFKLEHRVSFYTKMLAFFDKYIGPKAVKN